MSDWNIKSLKKQDNELANPGIQVGILTKGHGELPRFEDKLEALGLLPLKPTAIAILQINVGYMCNIACTHCHVDAAPDRKEIMTRETMQLCLDALDRSDIQTVDLTGGAPEMNPDFQWFVEEISRRGVQTIVRSNLTILVSNTNYREYVNFFKKHKVQVIASMPCYTKENVDKQRGEGVFSDSIEALKLLNAAGYGMEGSGLELHLVYNPGGIALPGSQEGLQVDYKRELSSKFGVYFNNLYTITNMPISRFLDFLVKAGRYEEYMTNLVQAFNPAAAFGVMCRNTVSVGWQGDLYDCDFNQALELKLEKGAPQHIRDFNRQRLQQRNIVLNQHCYGCTAGAGSSCQGAITSSL